MRPPEPCSFQRLEPGSRASPCAALRPACHLARAKHCDGKHAAVHACAASRTPALRQDPATAAPALCAASASCDKPCACSPPRRPVHAVTDVHNNKCSTNVYNDNARLMCKLNNFAHSPMSPLAASAAAFAVLLHLAGPRALAARLLPKPATAARPHA